jgi:hypothetical protein
MPQLVAAQDSTEEWSGIADSNGDSRPLTVSDSALGKVQRAGRIGSWARQRQGFKATGVQPLLQALGAAASRVDAPA